MYKFSIVLQVALLSTLLALTACSSSNSSSSSDADTDTSDTLTGTAAVGAAIGDGIIVVTDGTGLTSTTTTGTDGSFSITVNEAPPYILQVTSSDNGTVLYSFALGEGTVNITPLTDLALYIANDGQDRDDLFTNWASLGAFTEQDIETAVATVSANIQNVLEDNGVNVTLNYFTQPFSANGMGLDAVLDDVNIAISGNSSESGINQTIVILVNGTSLTFDAEIDTSSIIITPGGGEIPATSVWTLTTSITTGGVAIITPTQTGILGSSVPQVETEIESLGETFANTSISTPELTVTTSFSSITITSDINNAVGDTVTGHLEMTISTSGTINGIPIDQPPTTSVIDYQWERTQ